MITANRRALAALALGAVTLAASTHPVKGARGGHDAVERAPGGGAATVLASPARRRDEK